MADHEARGGTLILGGGFAGSYVGRYLRKRGTFRTCRSNGCWSTPRRRSSRRFRPVPNLATPGQLDPPTCQHALRQARRLAKNLTGDARPYKYRMLGEVATLGRYKGIANVLGIRLRGFIGWWVTRTYHLYQLPLLSRKLRVVADWTVALLFRRDIAELGTLGHRERVGDV